jgi:hypothetical protein
MYNSALLLNQLAGNKEGGGNPATVYNVSPAATNTDTTQTAPVQFTPAGQFAMPKMQPSIMPVANPPDIDNAYNMGTGVQNKLLAADSPYMQAAKQAGLEYAAKRGLLNSSIAGGASQKAAIEASNPIVNNVLSVYGQERGAQLSDWMSSEALKRDFSTTLAALPIKTSFDMLTGLAQAATNAPDVFTPEYINSMSNFFTANMQNVMANFFGAQNPSQGGGG